MGETHVPTPLCNPSGSQFYLIRSCSHPKNCHSICRKFLSNPLRCTLSTTKILLLIPILWEAHTCSHGNIFSSGAPLSLNLCAYIKISFNEAPTLLPTVWSKNSFLCLARIKFNLKENSQVSVSYSGALSLRPTVTSPLHPTDESLKPSFILL